ncbi:MAG: CCA tRNA nucleotidyltransferase [Parachlamydiales bacterium]
MKDSYPQALSIIKKLNASGYTAFFAGGWVRDFLLGHPSDDIDIATDASPQVILDLFPRTLCVGIAFGVVIVDLEGHQFEVATFRRDIAYTNGRKPDKIEMSSPREDAERRDFTINGMFYDPLTEEIFDYIGGMHDLKQGIIRCIGIPDERFKEDRLRMIRAVRFSQRFGFTIDSATQEAILENCDTLFPAVAIERVWQELNKMAQGPSFDGALITLHRLGLLNVIFTDLKNLHMNDLKHLVAPFKDFPEKTPTLLFVLQLFPSYTLDNMLDLCAYLKLSGEDRKIAETWHELESLNNMSSRYAWAKFYARKYSSHCVNVMAAIKTPLERTKFLEDNELRTKDLGTHTQRLIAKKPVVTSGHLLEEGIRPGVTMGKLLRIAEEVSIEKDLHQSQSIIEDMKKNSKWSAE